MSGLLRRWWLLVPMGVLLLAGCFLIALKVIGSARWAEAMDRRRAAGEPLTYEAWLATLPPIDASAAADLRAAVAAMPDREVATKLYAFLSASAAVRPVPASASRRAVLAASAAASAAAAARTALETALADQATAAAAVRAVLARPGAVLSHRDLLPPTSSRAFSFLSSGISTNLLLSREITAHHAAWALLDGDATPHLAVLRRWSRAMHGGETLIEVMIAVAIEDMVLDAHSTALVSGRLSATAAAEWIADRPDTMGLVMTCLKSERLGWLPAQRHYPYADLAVLAFGLDGDGSPLLAPWGWAVQDGDMAMQESVGIGQESALATGATASASPLYSWWLRAQYPIGSMTVPNASSVVDIARRGDAAGRIHRIAAALWFGARGELDASATRALPAVAPLLDQGQTRIRLGVESLGGRRIRVAYDLSLRQPGGLDRSTVRVDRCIGGAWRTPDEPRQWAHEGVVIDLPP